MPTALLADIKTSHIMSAPSRLLALLDRILLLSLESESTSCRVWARGVKVSNPDAVGWMFVEIGGGETGLDVMVCLLSVGTYAAQTCRFNTLSPAARLLLTLIGFSRLSWWYGVGVDLSIEGGSCGGFIFLVLFSYNMSKLPPR
jgi:hypothetical protein